MRHRICGRSTRLFLLLVSLAIAAISPTTRLGAAFQAADDRERAVMERYRSVLEKAPKRGVALDRVYGYHVERGELDAWIRAYADRTRQDPKDGNAWMLLGLIESQRGRDASAVTAFRAAEEAEPDQPLPAYYLGQALVLVGEPSRAAEAFERALTRKPSRTDLLEIFQALGRVHQRARRDDQALAVWTRLEKLFPDDPRVQEQVAASLAEEAKFDAALTRYEALAGSARDPYRRVRFRTEAADLKVRLGRPAEALRDYETVLAGLEPESWLHREVRRKIEEVFTRGDDLAGLAAYYGRWIEKSPEDVDAMARLAKVLASQGRSPEARKVLDRALKLAPSNRALRLELIEQLAKAREYAEAASQYATLARSEPNNPDVIRDWGRMLLRDDSKPEADRKRAAVEVWRKRLEARPDDPSATSQVADLLRQAGLVDEAIGLYRRAIELAPGSPQYREYLGEYFHSLKRTEEALATWRKVAEGLAKTPANLERLGEVLAGFGYKAEAIEAVLEATRLEPASFNLRVRLAGLYLEARRFDEAEAQLALAEPLASDDEAREEILARQLAVDEAAGRLLPRMEAIQARVAGAEATDPRIWLKLARYAEAARRPVDAISAAEKAIALDGKSVAARATLARLFEASGRIGEAAGTYRELAGLDRRTRSESLTNVAKLEARLGRRDEALKAGRELMAASPGNPETLQFYSDLCFQVGENEEGLETLRRAVRANDSDTHALVNLAEALAREFRTEEAIELYWRAFDRGDDLDFKLGLIERLAELHLRRNQFERLTARLERLQGEEGKRREASFYLAKAFASLGDFGTARRQLEGLLEANPRDTVLLKQLARLSEDEGDYPSAVKYLQQIYDAAPGDETGNRLAQMALRAGEIDVAEALWARTSDTDKDLSRVLLALDNLASHGRYESVLATTGRLLAKDPGNWELLYREAHCLTLLDRKEEASRRYLAILGLRRDDNEASAIVKARMKMTPSPGGAVASPASVTLAPRIGIEYRISATRLIRGLFGLDPSYLVSQASIWAPTDFGQARMAALASELFQARQAGSEAEWVARHRPTSNDPPIDARTAWDGFYAGLLRQIPVETYESSRVLVRAAGGDPSADFALLSSMTGRAQPPGGRVTVSRTTDEDAADLSPPLPGDELDQIRDAYRSVVRSNPSRLTNAIMDATQAELRKAGRLGEVDAEYRILVEQAREPNSIATAGWLAADRGDIEALRTLEGRFYRTPPGQRPVASSNQPYYVQTPRGVTTTPSYALARAFRVLADARAHGEILRLLDEEMAAMRTPARVNDRARVGSPSAAPTANARQTYPVFTSRLSTMTSVDYPTPGRYLDAGAILLLRNAHALFKRDDLLSDLTAHLKAQAEAASKDPSAELYARLALSAAAWWSEDKEGALQELARASRLAPGDVDLKLLMAEFRAQKREPDEALAILDTIEATDQDVTRRRELLALRAAVSAGRADRARQAAERLFGLRLDGPTQVQLAAQMQQLGMNDLADAVLERARRQVGNNIESLASLMTQYQQQGNAEAAVQIALQLLRRYSTQGSRLGEVEEPAQRQAIQVLAGSGKLREMIDRVEAQRQLSPQSTTILQTLAAYYRAAGQTDKLKATYLEIARLRPNEVPLRVQMAIQLAQLGETDAALDQFRDVFKKDPSLFTYYMTSILAAFQQANRVEDMVKLLDQVGVRSIGDYSTLRAVLLPLMQNPKTFDQGLALLGKAFEAFPNERSGILGPLVTLEPFWSRPGSYEFAKQALIPGDRLAVVENWSGFDLSIPVGGWLADGRILTSTTRLLEVATRDGRLDDLAGEVEATTARRPNWPTGRAALGLIRLRQGRVEDGRRVLQDLLADPATRPPFEVLMIIGQELRGRPELRPLAISVYEKAVKSERAWTYASLYFPPSAVRQLALLFKEAGRIDEALSLVTELESRLNSLAGSSANLALVAYRRLNCLAGIGELDLELGDPARALRLFDEFLGSTDEIQTARAYPTRNILATVDAIVDRVRAGVDRTLQGLQPETLGRTWKSLIPEGKRVDLLLLVHPREVDRATVKSLLATALDRSSREPGMLDRVRADLDTVARARPGDLEAQIAVVLANLGKDPAAIATAAQSLDRRADASPPEPIAAGARANARQREEARPRMALWLVARACWEHDSTAEVGDRLAAKALEAARRQLDPSWRLAMLRELGQRSLDRGDRVGAEAQWGSMLDLILADVIAMASTSPTPPTPGRPGATPRVRVPAPTVERFRQAAELSRLAADRGMAGLSLKAVRESLKGGPPVLPVAIPTLPAGVVRTSAGLTETPPDPALQLVEARLVELDALWTRNAFDPVAAYETVRDAVLPIARPNEVFLYDPTTPRPTRRPAEESAPEPARIAEVARILARRAVAADRVDDLRRKVTARQEAPAARAPAKTLLRALDEAVKGPAGNPTRAPG